MRNAAPKPHPNHTPSPICDVAVGHDRGGSRISTGAGGHQPRVEAYFEMYVKMKEPWPLGGRGLVAHLDPPMYVYIPPFTLSPNLLLISGNYQETWTMYRHIYYLEQLVIYYSFYDCLTMLHVLGAYWFHIYFSALILDREFACIYLWWLQGLSIRDVVHYLQNEKLWKSPWRDRFYLNIYLSINEHF